MQLRRLIRQLLSIINNSIRFIGREIYIHPTSLVSSNSVIRVNSGGTIRIGKDCEIHDFTMIMSYGGNISIGDHCSINPFSILYGAGGLRIGKGVRIAAHTVIIPSNHIPGDEKTPLFLRGVTAKGIEIGDYTWIGASCKILDGVRIGRHAIIGAGSVVTSSIPDNATAVGVPARVVKQR